MRYTAVIEKCSATGLLVGYVPGFPGAHTQADTLDELNRNLHEVIAMLLENGTPQMDGEFVGTQLVTCFRLNFAVRGTPHGATSIGSGHCHFSFFSTKK